MSKERPQPEDTYGFTERERLWDRISDKRFQAILADEGTAIHEVYVSTNSYGEFVFVYTSRAAGDKRHFVTFFGCGYHEYRERWITEEWFWHRGNALLQDANRTVAKEEMEEILRERREEIAPYVSQQTQSKRGKLFEMIADVSDDDGAISEMEDLGDDLTDWLSDVPE